MPLYNAVAADTVSFDDTGLDNTDADDVQEALEDLDAAITAGGSGTGLVKIAETLLGADAAAITFTGIASGYSALMAICRFRSARVDTDDDVWIRVGNGSIASGASDYSWVRTLQGAAAVNAQDNADSEITAGMCPGTTGTADIMATLVAYFYDYDTTTYNRTVWFSGGFPTGTGYRTINGNGNWHNKTSAIDQVSFVGASANLLAGSSVALYGLP